MNENYKKIILSSKVNENFMNSFNISLPKKRGRKPSTTPKRIQIIITLDPKTFETLEKERLLKKMSRGEYLDYLLS